MKLDYSYNNEIKKWCNKWNIGIPKLVFDMESKTPGYYELPDNDIPIIGVNSEIKSDLIIYVILHELRHHYQNMVYPLIFQYWFAHKSLYNFFYKSPLCNIEEDARIFAWTLGKMDGEIFLDIDNVIEAEYIRDSFSPTSDGFRQAVKKCEKIEAMNGLSIWKHNYRYIVGEKSEYDFDYILSSRIE